MAIKLFSFFSGAGLLDLGFELNQFEIVYVNEFHKPFLKAYKYSRDFFSIGEPIYGYNSSSITDLISQQESKKLKALIDSARKGGDLIGFIGGPPCPDFSVGGKNRGRYGDNGKLSQIYANLICAQRPDFFLFENVKGLFKNLQHRYFYEELKRLFSDAGFILTDRIINSIEYGAPQDRERIILLGFQKHLLPQPLLREIKRDEKHSFFPWNLGARFPNRNAFSYNWPTISPFIENSKLPTPEGIPIELTVEHWFNINQVDNHPNAEHCFKLKAGLIRFQTVSEGDNSKKSFKRLHRWRYSPTAAYGNNEVHLHPYKARRLTVAEALAIQSLPKMFSLPPEMTLSDMFKTVGNGVPYLAGQSMARAINTFLRSHCL